MGGYRRVPNNGELIGHVTGLISTQDIGNRFKSRMSVQRVVISPMQRRDSRDLRENAGSHTDNRHILWLTVR